MQDLHTGPHAPYFNSGSASKEGSFDGLLMAGRLTLSTKDTVIVDQLTLFDHIRDLQGHGTNLVAFFTLAALVGVNRHFE
jgi:hypothetical protein